MADKNILKLYDKSKNVMTPGIADIPEGMKKRIYGVGELESLNTDYKGDLVGAVNEINDKLSPADSSIPGPQNIKVGDMEEGYFGVVAGEELITGDELAKILGVTQGVSQNSDTPWHKFGYKGKTLFISQKTIRHSVSWDHLNEKGVVYGDKIIKIGGVKYRPRLIKGALTDPSDYNASDRGAKGSEWNRLVAPLSIQRKNNNWDYPVYIEEDLKDWGTYISDSELTVRGVNGRRTWCQEVAGGGSADRVNRGRLGVSISNAYTSSNTNSDIGWRPVLEVVSPEDIDYGPGSHTLIAGDMEEGFFGEVPVSEMITGDELCKLLDITEGVSQFSDEPWLKFALDGKILFRPKKAIRHSLSWEYLHDKGVVHGGRYIELNGRTYSVRLMKGASANPAKINGAENDASGSEWNRLMLPIHVSAKDGSWAKEEFAGSNVPYWGVDYTNEDLNVGGSVPGSGVWCQEKHDTSGEYRLHRGASSVEHMASAVLSSDTKLLGFAPVLELVTDVDPRIGMLGELDTDNKSNIVNAMNELKKGTLDLGVMSIGGRNYAIGTRDGVELIDAAPPGVAPIKCTKFIGSYAVEPTKNPPSNGISTNTKVVVENVEIGWYTHSYLVKTSVSGVTVKSSNDRWIPLMPDVWQRVSMTTHVDDTSRPHLIRGLSVKGLKAGQKLFYKEIKVEKGKFATDWTPNLEDAQGEIGDLSMLKTNNKSSLVSAINEVAGNSQHKVYGVEVDETNLNPETAVTYIADAVGMTPAKQGNYGSWESWLKDISYRVVVKGGKEQYQLDYDDPSKTISGEDAVITGEDGDVFTKFKHLHRKFKKTDKGYRLYISDVPFNGSISYTQMLEDGYNQLTNASMVMLQDLYLITHKNRDSQTALGKGYVDFTTNDPFANTGGTNGKGYLHGEATGKQQMCFLGIEDMWGNKYQWVDGLVLDSSYNLLIGYKSFNDSGSNYKKITTNTSSFLSGYAKTVQGGEAGYVLADKDASSSTGYCDSGFLYSGRVADFGGDTSDGSNAGAFRVRFSVSASGSKAHVGSRLCFKNEDGVYIGNYLGYEQSGKLRSIVGKEPTGNKTIGAFRTLAQANN